MSIALPNSTLADKHVDVMRHFDIRKGREEIGTGRTNIRVLLAWLSQGRRSDN